MGHSKAWISAAPHLLTYQGNRHRYPLVSLDENSEYRCNECMQKGFGTMLRCQRCKDYQIHPHCKKPPTTKTHPLRKNCIFKFCSSGGNEYRCEACSRRTSGSFYRCLGCNKVIHLYCANLKKKISIDNDRLMLMEGTNSGRCWQCRLPRGQRRTWVYASQDGRHRLHIHCARKLIGKCIRKSTSQQIVQYIRERGQRINNVELWITMAAAIVSALMSGNPTGLVEVFVRIFCNNNNNSEGTPRRR